MLAPITQRAEEWHAMHAERARIASRIPKERAAANDNVAWPLARALLAEGNKDLLKYAVKYRLIYDRAKSEVVFGGTVPDSDMGLEQRVANNDNECLYLGVRQSNAAAVDIPAKRKRATDSLEPMPQSSNVPKPWNGDYAVNVMIDAKRELARLQLKLGPIVEPFEMAVVDGATLEAVGNAAGIASRGGAMSAGRAIVHLGLVTLRGAMGGLNRMDFE